MSETVGAPTTYRVVYIGTGRQHLGLLRWEPERVWRQRQAREMEETCQEMARQGLRLFTVVPVMRSDDLKGGWTEGAWLYFTAA